MAYTTVNKSTSYFKTLTYSGDGTSPRSITGVGLQPDFLWIKNRTGASSYEHRLMDAVRGSNRVLHSSTSGAETSEEYYTVSSFDSDGWTGRNGTGSNQVITGGNDSGYDFVAWNWLAGGTSPSKTYAVTVVSDSGNKYRFDGYGTSAVTLDLQEGGTYTFDQSDSSNSGHPFRFSTTSDGTHGAGTEYTTNVTTNGTPGQAGAYTRITVAASAPTLYYYCSVHSGMGGQANTNTTFGSSNFDGTYQSLVSANTTSGFSIVKFTGTGSDGSVGHGLGATPGLILVKNLGSTTNWTCYHKSLGTGKYIQLNTNVAPSTAAGYWGTVDSNSFGVTSGHTTLSNNYIAYCFADVKGYCKIGSYTGDGSTDGPFIYTGFRPAFILTRVNGTDNWRILDEKRLGYNPNNSLLQPSINQNDSNQTWHDIYSNGFKLRTTDTGDNADGVQYIYMAIGQSLVSTNNIPVTAR